MTDELRAALTALAILCYGVFTALAIRSARHAGRVANQWDNTAGDHWRAGKLALVVGIIGVFFTTQQFEPIEQPWRALLFFAFLGQLIYGEFRIGSGFRDVANAQDKWHRRNFGEE